MWIVKLGGSLADSAGLTLWLETLSQIHVVIVPGGGPFADAVRNAQARWHFDGLTAHHMAILAMRQYGRMLTGLCPRLLAASSLKGLAQQRGQAKVWLPSPEALDAAGIPASWDITSDSLAAWLAGQMDATHLLLVKSVTELDRPAAGRCPMTFTEAAGAGWVDAAFSHYAMNRGFQSWLCGPQGYARLPQAFVEPADVFTLLHSD
jgi:aspartokinase-like uncharacterized kinase